MGLVGLASRPSESPERVPAPGRSGSDSAHRGQLAEPTPHQNALRLATMPATAGRVRMPANNRMQTSASLNTHGIWQNAIGCEPA